MGFASCNVPWTVVPMEPMLLLLLLLLLLLKLLSLLEGGNEIIGVSVNKITQSSKQFFMKFSVNVSNGPREH